MQQKREEIFQCYLFKYYGFVLVFFVKASFGEIWRRKSSGQWVEYFAGYITQQREEGTWAASQSWRRQVLTWPLVFPSQCSWFVSDFPGVLLGRLENALCIVSIRETLCLSPLSVVLFYLVFSSLLKQRLSLILQCQRSLLLCDFCKTQSWSNILGDWNNVLVLQQHSESNSVCGNSYSLPSTGEFMWFWECLLRDQHDRSKSHKPVMVFFTRYLSFCGNFSLHVFLTRF